MLDLQSVLLGKSAGIFTAAPAQKKISCEGIRGGCLVYFVK